MFRFAKKWERNGRGGRGKKGREERWTGGAPLTTMGAQIPRVDRGGVVGVMRRVVGRRSSVRNRCDTSVQRQANHDDYDGRAGIMHGVGSDANYNALPCRRVHR